MRKLIFLGLGACIYLGIAYWPTLRNYSAIRFEAQKLAGLYIPDAWERSRAIESMTGEIARKTGLTVFDGDVRYEIDEQGAGMVEFFVALPVDFPVLRKRHHHRVNIRVVDRHPQGAAEARAGE